jgi:hypothetical protein
MPRNFGAPTIRIMASRIGWIAVLAVSFAGALLLVVLLWMKWQPPMFGLDVTNNSAHAVRFDCGPGNDSGFLDRGDSAHLSFSSDYSGGTVCDYYRDRDGTSPFSQLCLWGYPDEKFTAAELADETCP